jgi:hypothetical protein
LLAGNTLPLMSHRVVPRAARARCSGPRRSFAPPG